MLTLHCKKVRAIIMKRCKSNDLTQQIYTSIFQLRYAGQTHTQWARRLKVPLTGITWKDIDRLIDNTSLIMQTIVPGTGKDGGPNCATVKPFDGWKIIAKR